MSSFFKRCRLEFTKDFCFKHGFKIDYYNMDLTNSKYFEKAELFIYSRHPISDAYFREIFSTLSVDIKINNRKVKTQVTHFKAGKDSEKVRQKHIQDVLSDRQNTLRRWDDKFLLGDFKECSLEAGDEGNVKTIKEQGFIDCWEQFYDQNPEDKSIRDHKNSFDVETNDMAKRTSENGVQRGRAPKVVDTIGYTRAQITGE